MKISIRFLILIAAFLGLLIPARAGFFDQLKTALTTNSSPVAMAAGLSEDQIASGLKQALGKGVSNAVMSLGHSDGFLTNLTVKIPLPAKLQSVESALRLAGQSKMADDFVASMNHAAEQAVPVAAGVFGDAIQQMSVTDAKAIARAMRYTANLIGVDHVAHGSDFDGSVETPFDTAGLARLTQALIEEGFSDEDVGKIMGGNQIRFLLDQLPAR